MAYRIPEEIDKKILAMNSAGYTLKEIAARLNISNHQTVSNRLRANGVRKYAERKDKGYQRRSEEQLEMFTLPETDKPEKRKYTFSPAIINAQSNNAESVGIASVDAYLSDRDYGRMQFNEHLIIPALNPLSMDYRYGKKQAVVSDYIVKKMVDEFQKAEKIERLAKDYHRYVVPVVLSNLYLSVKHNRQITYSRDNNKQDHKVLRFIDFLHYSGYIVNVIQPKQIEEENRLSSWFSPTKQLAKALNLPDVWTIRLTVGYKPVVIRSKKSGRNEEIKPKVSELRAVKRESEVVDRYNRAIEDSDIRHLGMPLACYLYRIFNEDMQHGGRFYGGMYQTMPKSSRAGITIDGEVTVEIDYSAIHPNLLFWMASRDAPEDVYSEIVEQTGLDRVVVKSLLLRLLNANSDDGFKRTVSKSGNPDVKDRARRNPSDNSGMLEGFILGVPDGYKGANFINAISESFPELTPFIGKDRLGVTLQWHDAQIMAVVIAECLDSGFICLPVHDSIIVPHSKAEEARSIMTRVFSSYTNGRPIQVK